MTSQRERQRLLEQMRKDLMVVKAVYSHWLPAETIRLLNDQMRLCTLLSEALAKLEEQHGSKAG